MVFFPALLYNGCMDKKKLLLIDGSSVAFWYFLVLSFIIFSYPYTHYKGKHQKIPLERARPSIFQTFFE